MTDLRVVLVGSGQIGLQTARLLDDRGHDVVVVDRNPERCEKIVDERVATVIEGDAARPSVLRQTKLDRADVCAALTNTLGINIAICTTVARIAPDVRTVLRATPEEGEEVADYADEIVHPDRSGARTVTNAVVSGVQAIEAVAGGLEVFQVTVTEAAPVANRRLTDVSLPEGSLVVSDADHERIASSETTLTPGRSYTVATEPAVADEVVQLFRG